LVESAASARSSHCGQCVLNALCVPEGLSGRDRQDYTSLVFHYRRLQAGQALFRAGEAFNHLYFVKTGSLKSMVLTGDGREQVTGFHFAGDALGLDALATGTHPSESIALEETASAWSRCKRTCSACWRANWCAIRDCCCCSDACRPMNAWRRFC
jgi:CRP/FNR family transcriptional regulator